MPCHLNSGLCFQIHHGNQSPTVMVAYNFSTLEVEAGGLEIQVHWWRSEFETTLGYMRLS